MAMKHIVRFDFEGSIELEVNGDPESDDWTDALGQAWARLAVGELSEAANLTGHVLLTDMEMPSD